MKQHAVLKTLGVAVAGVVVASTASATGYTSASYEQAGLIAQWDAIDNAGTGTHDPATNVWKDLTGNGYDLTLTANGSWQRGLALAVSGPSAVGTNTAPAYKTIEVLYRATNRGGRILFASGLRSRFVLFDAHNTLVAWPYAWGYFDGSDATRTARTPFVRVNTSVPNALAAVYDGDTVRDVYCDGAEKVSGRHYNTWYAGDGVIMIGDRKATGEYPWYGEVYAIRLYDVVLTPEQIARNHAIDVKRYFTSALYDKTGMVSFWDAIDNTGTGTHDSNATTWKNLIPGGQDLTLEKSLWADDALCCNGTTKSGAYGTGPLAYKTLQISFRNERPGANAWLFSGGIDQYCVLATTRTQWRNNEAIRAFDRDQLGRHTLNWACGDTVTNVYVDGALHYYGYYNDYWSIGGNYVQVGGRASGGQTFKGRIHTVRAYADAVDSDVTFANDKIDRMRYAHALTWQGPASAVGSGDFGASDNWVDVDRTAAVPGAFNTLVLPSGTYTITLDQDRQVSEVQARNGNVGHQGRHIDVTLNLNGYTLDVQGGYLAEAVEGYDNNRYAALTITNGTFKALNVDIGPLSDFIQRWTEWIEYAYAFSAGSGSLSVQGAGASASVANKVTIAGPFTQLRVADGATLACGGLWGLATQARKSAYPADTYDRMRVDFTGAGTIVDLGAGGLNLHRDVDLTISDGAAVTITGAGETFSPLGIWANVIGRSFEGRYGGGTRLIVDNASLSLTNRAFVVGETYKAQGGPGASFTLQNNATLSLLAGVGRFIVGSGRNYAEYNSTNNVLNVLDGSVFDGEAVQLEVGRYGNASFSGVNVSNATVKCAVVYLGNKQSATCSSNNFLNVSGATAKIDVSGTDPTSLQLRTGAQLRFTLPTGGFAQAPITTAGGVHVEPDELLYDVDPVKLVIDASAFDPNRVGKRATLISCATDSTDAFQRLIEHVEFVNLEEKYCGTLSIKDNGTKFVYAAPAFAGTVITLR